jgi:GT2 family glycosyltransferase/glycosyltransferase involved in cell wall biosynthesis
MIDKEPSAMEEQLRAAKQRICELEIDLQAARTRLREVTTSRTWALLDFFHRAWYWLRHAPVDQRRAKSRDFAERTLRRMGLYPLASRVWRLARPIVGRLFPGPSASEVLGDDAGHGYDVICLPVIAWKLRFQRPQQLMSQFADHAHRVFYAALGFGYGRAARLSQVRPNVFEMTLPGRPNIHVHRELPSEADLEKMVAAVDRLRVEGRIQSAVVVVQLSFWTALAERLRERFGWPIVYDCMDDHSGFVTNHDAILEMEQRTIAESDLVVVTADALAEKVRPKARRMTTIRNACDYAHFSGAATIAKPQAAASADRLAAAGTAACDASRAVVPTPVKHPTTVGFYGAIAEWFDSELVARLAESRPAWRFELIGDTFTGEVGRLSTLPNVALLGEKPYEELPRLVAGWDCFVIPFKRMPLTEATNPVKAYEMLAAGKPVVAVDLPELRPMAREALLSLADDAAGFAAAIEAALADDSPQRRERRRAFAAQNTWADRFAAFDLAVRKLFPPASVVVVTYNNLGLTRMCIESVFLETDYPNFEVLAVDNASQDGTADWLDEASAREPRLRVIRNADNRGFSAANNQGLRAARGDVLCLLNNDTVVTRGWLSTLIGHLGRVSDAGMIGPTSNMVGNEAKVPVAYTDIADMPRWAAEFCRQHNGQLLPMVMLGFFCVALRREVYEKVGDMDEQFGLGYFEDTDYCYRAARLGYKLYCARDAFVHHWQGASFRLLGTDGHAHIYRKNQRLFESKWGADSMAGAY